MERKNCVTFAFINFFSIYLGWVSCFYFCKITFFIAGNAPLILKISNYKTDIILFLYVSCFFFSYALLFTTSLWIFMNYICHLNYLVIVLFLSLSSQP